MVRDLFADIEDVAGALTDEEWQALEQELADEETGGQGAKAALVVRVGTLPPGEDAEAIAEELPTLTGRAMAMWDEVMPEVAGLVGAEGE